MKNERAAHLVFFCKKSFLFLNNFFCRIVGSDSYRPARPKQKSRVCAMERTRERRMHLIFPKGWKKVGPYGRSVNGWEDGASALFSPLLFFLLLQNRQLAGFYFPHSSSSRMQCARIHIPFCLVKPQQQTHKLVSNCTWRFVCEGGNETGKKTKPISHPDCKGMRNTSTRERGIFYRLESDNMCWPSFVWKFLRLSDYRTCPPGRFCPGRILFRCV